MRDSRLHILDIRFENGRTATITIKDEPEAVTFRVDGLRHVVKTSLESYTVRKAELDEKRVRIPVRRG